MTEKVNKLEKALHEEKELVERMVVHMKSTDNAVSDLQRYMFAIRTNLKDTKMYSEP